MMKLPEMVDLGLPSGLKWAKWNVGATKESEYGLYFKWGETEGYEVGYANETNADALKTVKTVLDLEDDAATVAYGKDYRMPTESELKELTANTTTAATEVDGVKGTLFISKINGNTIFFPWNGYFNGSTINHGAFYGAVWSASVLSSNPYYAWDMYFNGSGHGVHYCNRYRGYGVRAVSE